jgi:NADH dehydrogenase
MTAVCLARSGDRVRRRLPAEARDRIETIEGTLFDRSALRRAAEGCHAAIHLVGIILQNPLTGQTFDRVHRKGTIRVIEALKSAGIRRCVHMSALGTRPGAEAKYHRTKHAAEQAVRESGLDWTILRPSLIHGPDGEFMRLIKVFVCDRLLPVIPYFGDGERRLQPVSVKDVAWCFVESLTRADTIGQTVPLGGPVSYSWKELYRVCQRLIPGARRKRLVSTPVPLAKALPWAVMPALTAAGVFSSKLRLLRFNRDQVVMSQEDNVCDHTLAERAFGITMRVFEDELTEYADQIR